MKVLVADKLEDSGRRGLAEIGCDVTYAPDATGDALTKALAETQAEVLVVRSTKVTAPMLEAPRLALVVRAGAGTNTIDVDAASKQGVWVANCPGKNAIAVAELAFALLLALDRHVVDGAVDLREGRWNKKAYGKARGLHGQTLGLLGTGRIGQEMILRARAFGMPVLAWSRSLTDERARELGIRRAESPTEVAAAADVVSVHLALSADTRGLVGDGVFASMKKGATFLNTARAEVVDQPALVRAIQERGLRVGLDVFAEEPAGGEGAVDVPLFRLPGVIGAHHVGASTDQAQEATAAETVRIVRLFKDTGRPPNVVNLAKKTAATHVVIVRHRDRVGVLAAVFEQLREAGCNVQETENIVFDGSHAAVARISVERAPSPEAAARLSACNADVLDVKVVALA